jgi:hypothetical protein
MRQRSRTTAAVAAITITLALAVVASACGGGSSKAHIEDELGFDPEGIIARQVKVEGLIRDCMKAQGFDYVPVDPVAQRTGLTGQTGFSEDEFEKSYGYGITTLYEQRRNPPTDPNTAIKNALGPADQTAYTRALSGEFADATFAVAVDTGDYSRLGGCTRTGTEAVFGGAQVLQDLVAKLEELDQRVLADPRLQKAVANWSDCVRAAGYDLADPEQVDTVLHKRLDAIVGPSTDRRTDYDKAALAALQRDEVAMVATDKACEVKHLQKVEDAVRSELEAGFREQNAALLGKVTRP